MTRTNNDETLLTMSETKGDSKTAVDGSTSSSSSTSPPVATTDKGALLGDAARTDEDALKTAQLIYARLGLDKELPADATVDEAIFYLWSTGFSWTYEIRRRMEEWYVRQSLEDWAKDPVRDDQYVFLRHKTFAEQRKCLMRPLRLATADFVAFFDRMGLFRAAVLRQLLANADTRCFFEQTNVGRKAQDVVAGGRPASQAATDFTQQDIDNLRLDMLNAWRPMKLYALACQIENHSNTSFGLTGDANVWDLVELGCSADEIKKMHAL